MKRSLPPPGLGDIQPRKEKIRKVEDQTDIKHNNNNNININTDKIIIVDQNSFDVNNNNNNQQQEGGETEDLGIDDANNNKEHQKTIVSENTVNEQKLSEETQV